MIDLESILPFTMTPRRRLSAMVSGLERIQGIEGDVVECGVWRGGNIIAARKACPERTCWLYDTFTGMTEPSDLDVTRSGALAMDRFNANRNANRGWCAASLDDVKGALRKTETFDEAKLRFIVGPVEQTLLDPTNVPNRVALLRLDTDWYASTKVSLEVLFPKLARGGILIVDDYGHWQGARKAVDEYFGPIDWRFIDYSAVMMVKTCSIS